MLLDHHRKKSYIIIAAAGGSRKGNCDGNQVIRNRAALVNQIAEPANNTERAAGIAALESGKFKFACKWLFGWRWRSKADFFKKGFYF